MKYTSSIWNLHARCSEGQQNAYTEQREEGFCLVESSRRRPMSFLAIASNRNLDEVRRTMKDHSLVDISLALLKEKNGLIGNMDNKFAQWMVRLLYGPCRAIKKSLVRILHANDCLSPKPHTPDAEYFGQSPRRHHSNPLLFGRKKPLPFGVNIAGYLRGEFGVAEGARASIKSLEAAGVPYALINVSTHVHRHEDNTVEKFSQKNPYRVNLIHVNADQSHEFARQKGQAYFQDRYNIGYWFWELRDFPQQWVSSFEYYQEIWVASAFCQESIARLSPVPVVKMTFPVLVDDKNAKPDRIAFGLPDDKFIFGFFFDYLSQAERKNPLGLIRAFRQTFDRHDNALLLIKTINAEHAPEKVSSLKDAARDYNIQFIDGHISRNEMTNLIASLDSYISLHHSEGFGIGMAHAMYMRKPVIATGYSGNMDFMNHNNSFLVRYKLAELKEDYEPYKKGNIWAEPDLEHASELMRRVFNDRDGANRVAEEAEANIKARMTVERTGAEMRDRISRLCCP